MFGCHNCGYQPEKDTPYEQSPCSRCRTLDNPGLLSFTREDPATYDENSVLHPAYCETETEDLLNSQMQKMISALSQTIHIMVRLKEKYPETYRVVEAKMDHPSFSYSQLAEMLACRKQNILYHLKRAMQFCPELSYALIIDPRYSKKERRISSRYKLLCGIHRKDARPQKQV